jgi:hypothetical protein
MPKRHNRSLWIAAIVAVAAICLGGCKTSKDATALATELSTTSKALSGYYAALDKELLATDQLNILGEGLNGTPYDQNAQGQVHDAMTAIEERQAMADTLGQVADAFGKLSGSTAGAEASSSAGRLEGAVEGLKLLPGTLNSAEKNALTSAVQAVVTLIQQHKERQAAEKMADTADKLAALFASEQNACNSINDQYADLSRSFAQALVRNRQVDTSKFASSLAASALAPYSLTAKLSDDVKARLDKEVPNEIARESAALKISHQKASDGMEKSLHELAKAITTLAADKPLATNGPAATLGAVNQWASTILGK